MHSTAAEIAEACGGRLLVEAPGREARFLAWDSRVVEQDALYVALRGERVDGHDYCVEAARKGAACVLVSRSLESETLTCLAAYNTAAILVLDVQEALFALAKAWRAHLRGSVLALTGSSGKTSTKNLIRDVLSCAGSVKATVGNQNNELGVPATLLGAYEETDYVVVEMGMRGAGQITELCNFVQPDAALVTNVGSAHIELLGSYAALAAAKCEVYAALNSGGVAYINADDAHIIETLDILALEQRGIRPVFFDGSGAWRFAKSIDIWQHAWPKVWASDIVLDQNGHASFLLHAEHFDSVQATSDAGEVCATTLALPGIHNVANACAAAAVGLYAGLSLDRCCEALAASRPVDGRQCITQNSQGIYIFDDAYNANPESMAASLASFAAMDVQGKRIAVLGDMYELGTYTEEAHVHVGRQAAKSKLDVLICVGELASGIAQAAHESGMDASAIQCVETAEEVLPVLNNLLSRNDIVLLKASHSVGLGSLVESLVKL